MDIRKQLLEELKKRTINYDIGDNEIFSAQSISESLHLSRNTVSQYLNENVKQGNVIKIASRPVYFFDRNVVEKMWGIELEKNVFSSLDEFLNAKNKDFERVIGYDGSLNNVVEHCKAAISYPGQGLPILILGQTGTGKSFIASMMYEYAVHQGILKENAKFITVNCSEYANNPELLTANLFGHVKGAYTSAEENQEGLISLANNGVLFLDEVHCLKAECQEKLFQFMDKGIYHCVGDNENWYRSNCRLIFATTENPQNSLLKTLLRRIPITVSIPSLKERPLLEKREIIYTMFKKESERIHKDISISNLALQTILDFDFKGNVGEMENSIKAICAKVFLKHKKEDLEIRFLDLPAYFFNTMKSVQLKEYQRDNETLISIHDLHGVQENSSTLLQLYGRILDVFEKWEGTNEPFTMAVDRCKYMIQNFIDYLFFKQKYHSVSSNEDFLLKMLDKIYSIIINKYSLAVPNNQIKIYSKFFVEYTKNVTDAKIWIFMNKEKVVRFQMMIQERFPRAYRIASEITENVALNLDVELDELMNIIMTLSFVDVDQESNDGRIGLILCHGYSTASSMADTANHMLGQHMFDGIDMELKISIDKIVQLVDDYLKERVPIQELILLVDMGSLEEIYEKITPLSDCNVGLINHVSTASVIEAGNLIKQGKSVKEILRTLKDNYSLSTHFIEGKKKKNAILTVCATGFGAAKKISELLLDSLPRAIDLEIIPYDYQSLTDNGRNDSIFYQYNVKLIVGTLDPHVEGIEYVAMESIVTNEEIQTLRNLIGSYLSVSELDQFNASVMKNFTLSNIVNQLTILNAEKVMEDVEEIVSELELSFHKTLSATIKVGLYVHISCLIERLILRQEITTVDDFDSIYQQNKLDFDIVKKAFSGVEMRYSVEIPGPEMLYILNYFRIES